MKRRTAGTLCAIVMLIASWLVLAGPAAADPRHCITYDFAGSELCVSENGVEGGDRFIPGEATWVCVIYTFSGGQVCVSSHGEIQQQ